MDINKYRAAYERQKRGAAYRGIEFKLTFPEWCEFWGEDIARRGLGPNDLQMCRNADTGPYALGNIRKGTAKDNAKTRGHMMRKRATDKAHEELQAILDAYMHAESCPEKDFDDIEGEIFKLGLKSSMVFRYKFAA